MPSDLTQSPKKGLYQTAQDNRLPIAATIAATSLVGTVLTVSRLFKKGPVPTAHTSNNIITPAQKVIKKYYPAWTEQIQGAHKTKAHYATSSYSKVNYYPIQTHSKESAPEPLVQTDATIKSMIERTGLEISDCDLLFTQSMKSYFLSLAIENPVMAHVVSQPSLNGTKIHIAFNPTFHTNPERQKQLPFITAHELAHAKYHDSSKSTLMKGVFHFITSYSTLASAPSLPYAIGVYGAGWVVSSALKAMHSRYKERRADTQAIAWCNRDEIKAAIGFFENLEKDGFPDDFKDESREAPKDIVGDYLKKPDANPVARSLLKGIVAVYQTHPSHQARIETLKKALEPKTK